MKKITASIENFKLAIENNNTKKTSSINLNTLVISPGGVGTTFLINHISKFIKVNKEDDSDNLKHLNDIIIDDNTKVIFISGNIKDIYKSIKRRNYLKKQTSKLGCLFCTFLPDIIVGALFKRLIELQINRFKNKNNVLNIEYDEIWDKKQEIKEYLGIKSTNFMTEFPVRKKRTS